VDKKRIIMVIILLLIVTSGASATAFKFDGTKPLFHGLNKDFSNKGWFSLDSVIVISWNANDTQTPLEPGGAPRIVNLSVTYLTTLSYPLIGKIILYYCIVTHQYVTVTMDLGEIPSWSTASLSTSEIQFPVSQTPSSQIVSLSIAVDEHAPAYRLCAIPIQTEAKTLHGPFGLIPLVNGCTQACTLNCLPGYLPHIIVEPESDHMDVIPGEMSHLYFNIINHGNARTVVRAEIIDSPGNDWNILITDDIILDENGSNFMFLMVTPPFDFSGTDTITASFTPYKSDDMSQYGAPVNVTIAVIFEP